MPHTDQDGSKFLHVDPGQSSVMSPYPQDGEEDSLGQYRGMSYVKIRERAREPENLRKLEVMPPLRNLRRAVPTLLMAEHAEIRDFINSRVFDGRLRWVNLDEAPKIWDTLRRKSPLYSPSRRVPSVTIGTPEGGLLWLHVTEHGSGKPSFKTEGTVLENRPFYAFWGFPNEVTTDGKSMQYYGIGLLPNHRLWDSANEAAAEVMGHH